MFNNQKIEGETEGFWNQNDAFENKPQELKAPKRRFPFVFLIFVLIIGVGGFFGIKKLNEVGFDFDSLKNPKVLFTWPTLTVTGFANSNGHNYAVINSQMVKSGDVIDGVNILKVNTQNVIVEFNGTMRTLSLSKQK